MGYLHAMTGVLCLPDAQNSLKLSSHLLISWFMVWDIVFEGLSCSRRQCRGERKAGTWGSSSAAMSCRNVSDRLFHSTTLGELRSDASATASFSTTDQSGTSCSGFWLRKPYELLPGIEAGETTQAWTLSGLLQIQQERECKELEMGHLATHLSRSLSRLSSNASRCPQSHLFRPCPSRKVRSTFFGKGWSR